MEEMFDIFIIGGGINGAGIARDAAGRNLKVGLSDKGEIGGATSSWSTKLIHGGLRYLENFEFKYMDLLHKSNKYCKAHEPMQYKKKITFGSIYLHKFNIKHMPQ